MKLPVLATVREAFALTGRNWDLMAVFAGIHALFYIVFGYAFAAYTGLLGMLSAGAVDAHVLAERAQEFSGYSDAFNFAYLIFAFLVVAAIATVWHRRFELGRAAAPTRSAARFDRRKWRMFWQTIKLFFVSLGAMILALAVSFAVAIAIGKMIGGGYDLGARGSSFQFKSENPIIVLPSLVIFIVVFFGIVSRVLLVLPACALDRKISLRDSWRFTRQNGTRMSLTLIAAMLLPWIAFVIILVAAFAIAFPRPGSFSGLAMIGGFFGAIVFVSVYAAFALGLVLSVLSIAYRSLADETSIPA